jgi:antirestriction protein ArdC
MVVDKWRISDAGGYPSGLWGTYKQWQDLGGQVRRNEKATTVIFYKVSENEEQ